MEQIKVTEQEAFAEGLRAWRSRLPLSVCEYPYGSDLYKEFYRGWFSEIGPLLIDRHAA